MPFILYGAVQLMSADYFAELKASEALVPAVVYGATSLIGSNFAIYRMVNFKV
jgi:hypothetical protein